jgi:CheY-like chemotaxis protein
MNGCIWEFGGRRVAKILVADDNSNVQKTMALALADLGVEVVSVNNGEAAVRKLADVSPDLVLADIFMPVRNGYEVCEYVKKDPRFAHIPVILLVGAFDPLDEREAQRVGADGILKKPFVPPDPLITMVKTLLDRSMSLVGVAASK